ncbi:hypothetical protein JRQ81_001933 [Phrynocephalus forsythii]|uniref:Uncharacterized protein n=1 Tax=Phrynocephalus forsythii TaxID=171643 RepID=A0A9Q0Y9D5_9SAUR|nr:hypothetical protein JRQ81_001933 [Phrynocephalus forsythii]
MAIQPLLKNLRRKRLCHPLRPHIPLPDRVKNPNSAPHWGWALERVSRLTTQPTLQLGSHSPADLFRAEADVALAAECLRWDCLPSARIPGRMRNAGLSLEGGAWQDSRADPMLKHKPSPAPGKGLPTEQKALRDRWTQKKGSGGWKAGDIQTLSHLCHLRATEIRLLPL